MCMHSRNNGKFPPGAVSCPGTRSGHTRRRRTFTAGGTTRPRNSRRTGAATPSTSHWNACEKSPSVPPTMRARTACGARGSRLPPRPSAISKELLAEYGMAMHRCSQGRQPGQQSRSGRTSAAPAASTPAAGSSAKRGAPGAAACGSSWNAASMEPLRSGRLHAGELAAACLRQQQGTSTSPVALHSVPGVGGQHVVNTKHVACVLEKTGKGDWTPCRNKQRACSQQSICCFTCVAWVPALHACS